MKLDTGLISTMMPTEIVNFGTVPLVVSTSKGYRFLKTDDTIMTIIPLRTNPHNHAG